MWRSGSVEVRPRRNDRSESEQALTLRHSDAIRLGDGVGRISSVRLDFAALRAELSGGHISNTATHESQRRNTRTSRPSGGGDGDSFPSTSIPCTMPALPCRRLRTTQGGPPFHATALPYMQCMHCNACLATHALHVWHARPGCLAKHASHAVIAPCFSAQKAVYLRK